MIQRGGEVVIRMLDNVQQRTIKPLIQATIAPGTCIYTDEYDIYRRLEPWGYAHASVCHSRGEYAREDDGDGFHEVHGNTMEGFWSLLSTVRSNYAASFTGCEAPNLAISFVFVYVH